MLTDVLFPFVGGLALFIYGMQIMAQGLQNAAGSKMKKMLEVLTKNKLMGVLLGAFVTAIIQSSSATTVMVVGFVNAGLMNLVQAMSVIMGANIGTTVTGWLVSSVEWAEFLSPSTLAPVVVMIGVVALITAKKNKQKEIASILIGFGILFIGIDMMSGAVTPLRDSEIFRTAFLTLGANPLLGVLAGAVVTAIIQSSSASVGILQTLAVAGLVPFNAAVYVIMGQNIGTCITAMLSSIGASRNAKSAAYMHLLFNIIGTIIFSILSIIYFKMINPALGEQLITITEISIVHTSFNVATTIILFPFSNGIIFLAKKLNKVQETEEEKVIVHLDDRVLETPSVAVQLAVKEVIRMGNVVLKNLDAAISCIYNKNPDEIEKVLKREEKIDNICDGINEYVVKICSKPISNIENETVTSLLHLVDDLERIGDHCENLAGIASEMKESKTEFSEIAMTELKEIVKHSFTSFAESIKAFENFDVEAARNVVREEDIVDELRNKFRLGHIQRLASNECNAEPGIYFLDILTNLERISDHSLNIAQVVLNENRQIKLHHSEKVATQEK
ncbi:Na/Pi cotransporter [Tyzzerella sp. An114]|uniref:Na/Pi cotransporter family protein n=1 Tax=Tyzzerella sp. An114 TaxID=1965545 RepID=UPI000B43DF6A|nr:Na/Pi cotransporter family protein [Tyzzerella sp. An114]OUQ59952.1 Na/Pi cotransporter [Tyzzerella sp. An114]